jgi:hypothetical protein
MDEPTNDVRITVSMSVEDLAYNLVQSLPLTKVEALIGKIAEQVNNGQFDEEMRVHFTDRISQA